MRWLTVIFLANAAACLTLAVIHTHVWFRQRQASARLGFAMLAASVAGMAWCELRMALSTSPAEYGRWLWWYQLPVWTGTVSLVAFVHLYLGAGRRWLGGLAVGLRTLAMAINLVSTPAIQFREITTLVDVTLLGDTVAAAVGPANPLLIVGHVSLLVLIAFVVDATWDLWRRAERRRALTIGGSLIVFVTTGMLTVAATTWAGARLPFVASLFFAPIVVAMAIELGRDLIRAVRLAEALDEASTELRTTEDRLALAADAAQAGLWSVDRATGRLWATPRAYGMFGLDPQRPHHAEDVVQAIHPDDRERVRDFTSAPAPGGAAIAIEYRVVHPAGERWYSSVGRLRPRGADGDQVMGVTIDITERKRAEDAAARQRAELEHLGRVAMVTELSSALAHELAQPLAIIMSNAEAAERFLARTPPDVAEVQEILRDIVAADARAGEVIHRLRSLLKRGRANAQAVDLNALLGDLLRFLRADLIRRGVTVEMALASAAPRVLADRVPLEQVLINIIGNACEAMAGNATGDLPLFIATRIEGDTAIVSVRDAGCGLPADMDAVFAPFYTTKPQGLGMGLAISRSIVAAHGGQLTASRNADRGSTFRIELPLLRAAAADPAATPAVRAEAAP